MRGGKREGAGRKPVLPWHRRIDIGSTCDNLQRELRERKALARHANRPNSRALQEARDRLKGKNPKEVARLIKLEIAPMLRGNRGIIDLPLKREKTRAEIIKIVADKCATLPGMQGVTPRRVEACWKEYRAFLNTARVSQGAEN